MPTHSQNATIEPAIPYGDRQLRDQNEALSLADDVVQRALRAGADEADAILSAGTEFEVTVRQGEIDRLIEAGSKALGLRVYVGGRPAVRYTSDFTSPADLEMFARDTVELAAITDPDPAGGLPDPEEWAQRFGGDLRLYDPSMSGVPNDEKIEAARRCEEAAFAFDPRVTNSDGATCSTGEVMTVLVNSKGFAGAYAATSAALQIEVMADDADGKKRNDYWLSVDCFFRDLESPERVGREAAERAVAQLGPRKPQTRKVPVVWENRLAQRLASLIARAASGEALYRRQTFLMDLEGEQMASALVSIVDAPLLPGRMGSRPFDGEGVTSRRNQLVEDGIFRSFLFDTYTARKIGRRTTGSASRGIAGRPGVGTTNLIFEPGDSSYEDVIASVDEGLLLTVLMGMGTNLTTGDFSQGAAGYWIEKGKIAYPVTEINVSGNLREMLKDIDMVGNDLFVRGPAASPTVRMSKLMVSGL